MTTAAKETKAPEETLSKGKVLAGLLRRLDEVRDERKESMAAFKKDEQRLQNDIRRLAGDIETGQSDLFDVENEPTTDVAEKIAEAMDGMVITTPNGTTATVKHVKKDKKKK